MNLSARIALLMRFVVALVAAVFVALTQATITAQTSRGLRLEAVIEVGDVAPGARDDARVSLIGDAPAIDQLGNVTVITLVRAASSPLPRQAILRSLGGRLEVVFEEGDQAPGTSDVFVAFPGLPLTPRIDGGRLFLIGTVQDASGNPSSGLWSDRSGGFLPIVMTRDVLPGMPAGAELADFDFTTRGPVVLLRGRFAEGGSIGPDSRGLWRNRDGTWQALVVRGLPAPGVSGATFSGSPIGPFGPIFAFGADANGRVSTQSWIGGRRIDEDNDEGLWVEGSGGLTRFATEGDRVGTRPRVTFGPTFGSPTFGGLGENVPLVMNAGGIMAFGAVLRTARERLNSIWTTRSGQPERLVTGGLPLVGGGRGDPAPGLPGGATFALFQSVALNEDRVVAFQGFADEFGDPNRLTEGIWWDAPGALTLAAAAGHPAPTLAGVTILDLRLEALAADGSLLVGMSLSGGGVTAANNAALYHFRADGSPTLILRTGDIVDVVDVAGATTRRTVASFRLGTGAALDGRRVIDVGFVDGTRGVYLVRM